MANAVMEANHGLMQTVGVNNSVLAALIAEKRPVNGVGVSMFNIDAPENLLFFSRNVDLAQATGTARHAGDHAAVADAQIAIFDKFGRTPTQFGKTYADLMKGNPANLSTAEISLRNQVFDQAQALATDLRDYTNKALIDNKLSLTKTDPKALSKNNLNNIG